MKTVVDARLMTEAALFRLRFACDDCVHFAPERDGESEPSSARPTPDRTRGCGHGWPVRLRRSVLDHAERDQHHAPEPALAFCKEFELA